MHTITMKALAELNVEKEFIPEEVLVFLSDRSNFMSVPVGIRRELNRLGYTSDDDSSLLQDFKSILKKAGFTADQRKNAKTWLIDGKLPSPAHNYPIRLCFAFGLKGQAALDFLCNVCLVNGFNFRRAEDVVFYYCLENDKSYRTAMTMIELYHKCTRDCRSTESDTIDCTRTLRGVFNDINKLDEVTFFKKLYGNKKNFIGYYKTAHEEYIKLYNELKRILSEDIERYNEYQKTYFDHIKGYSREVSVYLEIIYALDIISCSAPCADTPFGVIMENFPKDCYLTEMFDIPSAATDKENDKARKAFMLLFFAKYALELPPDSFFNDFISALNDKLYECGYAKLYPANPYDWLILKCIKSLDCYDPEEDQNPVELFNEILVLLASEYTSSQP